MKACKQIVVLLLSLALWSLPAAYAQGQGRDAYFNPRPDPSSNSAKKFEFVDQHLLEALRASYENERRSSLQEAQVILDAMEPSSDIVPGNNGETGKSAEWLEQTERGLVRFQNKTQKELRESLMNKLWASPYGKISIEDITVLEVISGALLLLHEIQRLESDNKILGSLQETYWGWLMSRREDIGLDNSMLADAKEALVFDQRVLRDKEGEVQLYQLIGKKDWTLQWVQVTGKELPGELLSSEAITVDLSRESAPWVLVFEGKELTAYIEAHRHWLEVINPEVRVVLLERGNFSAMLKDLPPEWFASSRRIPYVLPARKSSTPEQLYLVHVADKRVLANWPLSSLDGKSGLVVKDMVNCIIAASSAR